jgi:hypothetical protein
MAARAYVFTIHAGFTVSGQLTALDSAFRGLRGFTLGYGSQLCVARLRTVNYLIRSLARLHVSQAFHMMNSLQFTREVRLT